MKHLTLVSAALLLAAMALPSGGALAQDLRLRAGDELRLEVPGRDDLGRQLTVDARGQVALPLVGAVQVDGLTVEEARGALLRALQELYPSVQTVNLTLMGGEARKYIYVQGQVALPGKYDLEVAPTIWDAIREAGGGTAAAALESVRLIRVSGDSTTTTYVNVQSALDAGDLSSLPPLRPGDTIAVPERATAGLSATGAVTVVGAVAKPAPYSLASDKRVLDAILAAGGWLDMAALNKVTVIRPLPRGGAMTIRVDVRAYLETGDPRHNPAVYPNDTVSVPRKGAMHAIFGNPTFLLGLITAAATVTAIIVGQL